MVITVTLNPAVDKTLLIDNFSVGHVNRVQELRYDIGGKGINVSKVLKNFGIESICTGFLGGMWEKTFENDLKERGIASQFIKIKGDTRVNTKIVDKVNNVFTDINEPGPDIKPEDLRQLTDTFRDMCREKDIVVLSGGAPPMVPKDIYGTLTKIAREKGAYVILDADGELLKYGIAEKPDILKPNEHELAGFFNDKEADGIDGIIEMAERLKQMGIPKILVSLGAEGALYITESGIYHEMAHKVTVKSTVGAGDSMAAALVYGLVNGLSDREVLKFANACGAASVSTEGTEACTLRQVKELLGEA